MSTMITNPDGENDPQNPSASTPALTPAATPAQANTIDDITWDVLQSRAGRANGGRTLTSRPSGPHEQGKWFV